MPKLVWGVFCQHAVIDQFSNNLSVFNQLDEIHLPRPPDPVGSKIAAGKKDGRPRVIARVPSTLVTVWERAAPAISESSEFVADLLGPKGEKLGKFQASVDLRKHRRVRLIAGVPGIPMVGEGTYKFVLRSREGVRWKHVSEITFEVKYEEVSKLN